MTTPKLTGLRREQIGEALGDVDAVFLEPGCFGACSLADAVESLASEFVGPLRDDEILRRLGELVDAESAGNMRVAGRHLRAVRSKLAVRWTVAPGKSEPLIPDAEAKRFTGTALPVSRSRPRGAAKPLVAESRTRPVPPQPPMAGGRRQSPRNEAA